MRYPVKRILKFTGLALGLFIVFLVLTFPFDRLSPRLSSELSAALTQALGRSVHCELGPLRFRPLFRFSTNFSNCTDGRTLEIELRDFQLSLLPWRQSLRTHWGEGHIEAHMRSRLFGGWQRIQLNFESLDLEVLAPLMMHMLRQAAQQIPFQPDLEGLVSGQVDFPLQNIPRSNGHVFVEFEGLRLPEQSLLELIGLDELLFQPALIDVAMESGNLQFREVEFQSQTLSFGLEGNWQLQENWNESSGVAQFKWVARESDALRRSLLGPQLLNAPCPSRDAEGYCYQRFTRPAEIDAALSGQLF